jgi:ABC-type transport system involved in multi-copper enzyme maturation permease subunit
MESRTLYLILTRPVSRYQFVLGRFLGLLMLLGTTYVLMGGGHLLLLATQHVHPDRQYLLSLLYSWEKIMLITALAMAFSLFATSTISAIVFTLFFWVMGHFSSELRFLALRSTQPGITWIFSAFYYLAPNFQIMNLKDLPSSAMAGTGWLWPALGYGLTYTSACLVVVVLLFRKKEF